MSDLIIAKRFTENVSVRSTTVVNSTRHVRVTDLIVASFSSAPVDLEVNTAQVCQLELMHKRKKEYCNE